MIDSASAAVRAARLTRIDWLDHGLKALAAQGFTALKADTLARSLGVSRGSFYWHFKDIADFRGAVLERWRAVAAEGVIAEVERDIATTDRFHTLLFRAFTADPTLERAMRAWATTDSHVAFTVRRVDERRVSYLTVLLQASGVPGSVAAARARFAYWAHLGRGLAAGPGAQSLTEADLKDLSDLLTSPSPERR